MKAPNITPTDITKLSNSRFFIWFALVNAGVVATLTISSNVLGFSDGIGTLLTIALVLGCGGAFLSLLLSSWLATRAHRIQHIDQVQQHEYRWLVDDVIDLSKKAGLERPPKVGIWAGPDANAFATGRGRNAALVAFSEPLLQSMSRDQTRAIAAHEIAHVANRDMLAMTLLQGVVNTFVLIAVMPIQFVRIMNWFSDSTSWVVEILAIVFKFLIAAILTFIGSLFVNAFSRRREYRADAAAARLVSPEHMKSALQQLSMNSHSEKLPQAQAQFAAFKISGSGFAEFFSTHPLIEKRIQALDERTHDRG